MYKNSKKAIILLMPSNLRGIIIIDYLREVTKTLLPILLYSIYYRLKWIYKRIMRMIYSVPKYTVLDWYYEDGALFLTCIS